MGHPANNLCEHPPFQILYADIVVSGVVDLDDMICVICGIGNQADCPAADIAPCGPPDGVIDLDDLLSMLSTLAGSPPCPDPCP